MFTCVYLLRTHCSSLLFAFFFFNDTATTEIYTLSLHDALPISCSSKTALSGKSDLRASLSSSLLVSGKRRSEEHTSELQSQSNLVCRLLLEKKKKKHRPTHYIPTPDTRRQRSRSSYPRPN